MPEFQPTSPRESFKIQGVDLTIPYVYASGQTLTDKDAAFINSRLAGIMVNAYGGDIRRGLESLDKERATQFKDKKYSGPTVTDDKGKVIGPKPATVADLGWDHQAKLDEKFTNYKVGDSNARVAQPKSALETVARGIAVREIKDALTKQKFKIKPLMDAKNAEHGSEFGRLVHDRLNGKHKERIFALAQSQIDGGVAEDELDVPAHLRQAA